MEILDINKVNTDFVIKELKKGKIFFAPSDTCYGILGNIKKNTIERIFKIKKRLKNKALPLFVSKKWVSNFIEVNANFKNLVRNFWPGALTIIVKVKKDKENFLKNVIKNNNTIAVREPNYSFLNKIIDKYKEPLTATSANITKMDACYSVKGLINQFERRKYKPDYIIDAGKLPKKKSSSIIDSETLEIVRGGKITPNIIRKKIK